MLSGWDDCRISDDGRCISDGAGSHGNNEACIVRANLELNVTASYFATEAMHDYLEFRPGLRFSGSVGPTDVPMTQGETLRWFADASITRGGFVVCGVSTASPPPSPWCQVRLRGAQPAASGGSVAR